MIARGVLALWTHVYFFEFKRGPMLFGTLASNLAARHFPEMQLVTDHRGAAAARALGWPFGEINTALEEFHPSGQKHIWSLGKMVANALQDVPFLQFDWDVLLFERPTVNGPIFAQSEDEPRLYTSPEMLAAIDRAGLVPGLPAFNTGIVGGQDVALVQEYAREGLAIAARFADCPLNGTTVSMLVEQYHLGDFCRRRGVSPATLLPMRPTVSAVNAAGYAHFLGAAKHSPRWIARAEARLAKEFPEAHARFLEGWPHVDSAARA
jgi:hypothetical protein